MLFYIGSFIIIFSIIFGFLAEGGNIIVLFQPYAALIILGSAVGILLLSNPKSLLKSIFQTIRRLNKGLPYNKDEYLALLTFMFHFFKYARNRNPIEVENDIEQPYNSVIFKEFPILLSNREALIFFCDYMRMITLGYNNAYELNNLIEEQIQIRKNYTHEMAGALYKLGDALPALGIIAAVLGVINAMSSINDAPDILGHKIGAALIGTFIGVAAAYCIVNPLGSYLEKFSNDESKYLECIKAGFIAHMNGNSPAISIEFARQNVPSNIKPTFLEVEAAIESHKLLRKRNKNARREARR